MDPLMLKVLRRSCWVPKNKVELLNAIVDLKSDLRQLIET